MQEEEVAGRENLARQCHKAEEEMVVWRMRYEKDGLGRIEELESSKLKLQARLAECEETVGNMNGKLVMLERSRAQLQATLCGILYQQPACTLFI